MEAGEKWLNDGEGSQPRANCTFESIDNYYGQMPREGWVGLSYFNLFEYGENICGGPAAIGLPPPCNHSGVPSGASPSCAAAWANSSDYLLRNFPSAVISDFACGGAASGTKRRLRSSASRAAARRLARGRAASSSIPRSRSTKRT